MPNLKLKIQKLPIAPGVYLFKDAQGEVLYVGKAKNLKNRVRSYFPAEGEARQGRQKDFEARLLIMKDQIADLDYIVVTSELESLILENNLIKQNQPRFNVLLRDDKNYQFIKLDYETEIPQIYTVRKLPERRDKGQAKYFGPYTSGLSVKQTLHLIKNIFHLCRAKKVSTKPCFAYHLGRCGGVCFGKMSLAEYRQVFVQIEDFLRHRQSAVLANLKAGMARAAKKRRFETAALLRDKTQALEHLWQKQKIVSPKNENQDYLGLFREESQAVICLFLVREGKLLHTEYFEMIHQNSTSSEIIERFILQYYEEASDLPREVVISETLSGKAALEKVLSKLAGRLARLVTPRRGKKSGLLKLAAENARFYHERQVPVFEKDQPDKVLEDLARFLHLPKPPQRVEGYDISNIQGTNPVGSMVVFSGGQPDKSQYRKFKIKVKSASGGPDDFAMMREILTRRFARSSEEWPVPDLIIIDGGKGQLNIAVKVLANYKLEIPAIGLAKRLEEIFILGKKEPLILAPNSPVLFLLQRVRDEAHRFAITFYRARHRRAQTHSRLQDIPGVGPVTRRKLIKRFGSANAVREASLQALAAEVGLSRAKKIREQLSVL